MAVNWMLFASLKRKTSSLQIQASAMHHTRFHHHVRLTREIDVNWHARLYERPLLNTTRHSSLEEAIAGAVATIKVPPHKHLARGHTVALIGTAAGVLAAGRRGVIPQEVGTKIVNVWQQLVRAF